MNQKNFYVLCYLIWSIWLVYPWAMKHIARNWKFAASISGKTNKFIRTMRSKEKDWEILEMFVEGCSKEFNECKTKQFGLHGLH